MKESQHDADIQRKLRCTCHQALPSFDQTSLAPHLPTPAIKPPTQRPQSLAPKTEVHVVIQVFQESLNSYLMDKVWKEGLANEQYGLIEIDPFANFAW